MWRGFISLHFWWSILSVTFTMTHLLLCTFFTALAKVIPLQNCFWGEACSGRGPIQFSFNNLSVNGDGGVAGCGVHGCCFCFVAKGINQLPEDAIQLILLKLVLVDVGLRQILDDGREVLEHVRRLGVVPVIGGCDLPKRRFTYDVRLGGGAFWPKSRQNDSTASSSHLRTMLPESSSHSSSAKRPNHAT